MLGAIIGDIVGSRFEFNNHLSTDFELFHPDCSFTDDTICTVAVADWLMRKDEPLYIHLEADKTRMSQSALLAMVVRKWCRKYPNPTGGYGNSFREWVFSNAGPYNSYGNGSAMRVSPVGLWNNDIMRTLDKATESAKITHDHPEGIKGACAIAIAMYLLRTGKSKGFVADHITRNFGYSFAQSCDEIRASNPFNETCQVTVPQAFRCLLESDSFENAIRLAVSIGGDSDTIAAITGSLAEAHYSIPPHLVLGALEYLPDEMLDVVNNFYRMKP